MKFPVITVNALEKLTDYLESVALHAPFGIKPSPCLEVRLHGKQMVKLGEWEGEGYHYAAVREIGAKNTDYHLIDPKYINGN